MTKVSPTFQRVLSSAGKSELLLPVIEAYLHQGEIPEFTIKLRDRKKVPRKPNGWFHPSTHPLMTERQLYYYLAEPDKWIHEPLDPLGMQATTAGEFWHGFMEVCLTEAKLLLETEVRVIDEETGTRGFMDGRLPKEAFEFKTMNSRKLRLIEDGAPDDPAVQQSWRELVPQYNVQGNEYLRMSGLPAMRYLIMATEYPFPKREIVIPYDPALGNQIKQKYLNVRQAVADQRPPLPCCAPGSKMAKSCPARAVCPIALGTV